MVVRLLASVAGAPSSQREETRTVPPRSRWSSSEERAYRDLVLRTVARRKPGLDTALAGLLDQRGNVPRLWRGQRGNARRLEAAAPRGTSSAAAEARESAWSSGCWLRPLALPRANGRCRAPPRSRWSSSEERAYRDLVRRTVARRKPGLDTALAGLLDQRANARRPMRDQWGEARRLGAAAPRGASSAAAEAREPAWSFGCWLRSLALHRANGKCPAAIPLVE
ncbi:hypothetical protein SAMN04489834_0578 [Microterricola viridarii]|uniref:Uncharacterized protein n=1 Tax=Microterricola viridarii TaxID=412690 RepID=A0A1H1N7Z9_9MICO|nr:hypothetical protein SAMN04489834_0578 [Microterricola viridarii]